VPATLATANQQPDPKMPVIAKTVVPAIAVPVAAAANLQNAAS
jgi:hypothetical protein